MNKIKRPVYAVASLAAAALLGSGLKAQQKQSPPVTASTPSVATAPASGAGSPDKVVLKVGNEKVTQAQFDSLVGTLSPQMEQVVRSQGRRHIGEQYALMLLLSQKAASEHLDASPEMRRKIELQRLQLLANTEYGNLTRESTPTSEEISKYYSSHAEEFQETQARRVFIRKKPAEAKEGALGLDPQEAKSRAEAIRKALAGGTDGKKVAEEFKSKDVIVDAEPRTLRRGQGGELDKAVFDAKEGELTPLQETPQATIFYQVVKHRMRELKDATPEIQRKLQKEKLDATLEALKKGIWMDEEYFKAPPAPSPPAPSPGATRAPAPNAQVDKAPAPTTGANDPTKPTPSATPPATGVKPSPKP